jgi:acyl-CoA thioesterase II
MTVGSQPVDLGNLFDLEHHGPDTFVGQSVPYPWGGLYGGHIVSQALRAAASTVDAGVFPHSLRAYFIRRGDPSEPVRYEVDRIRNGRSFSTRRVVARQAVGAVLNLEASFHAGEESAELQTVHVTPNLPRPGDLDADEGNWTTSYERRSVPEPIITALAPGSAGRLAAWMRVTADIGDDPLVHACWLAYISDDVPTESVGFALRQQEPRVVDPDTWWEGGFNASLDHTIWFHRPLRADRWHLYEMSCHGYTASRGLAFGHVFDDEGRHVATFAQETLVRRPAAR